MPRGGKRAGAGRPAGSTDSLPRGSVALIKALRHRVPKDASPEAVAVADEALGTLVAVMRGEVERFARERMSAAALLREEVCGPVPKKLEHSGVDGSPISISINGIVRDS